MRLAAALLFIVTLLCMAGAAYLPGRWQAALYGAVAVGILFVLALAAAILEHLAGPQRAWVRALIALAAGAYALWRSFSSAPGALGDLPFHDITTSALSIGALACMIAAVGFGLATLRLDKRLANIVAALGMLLALGALRPWFLH